jgi:hypothetical protein
MEQAPTEEPQGQRVLKALGLEHLIGQSTGHEIDGQTVPYEDFHLLCGPRGDAMVRGFLGLDPSSQRYREAVDTLRTLVEGHLGLTDPDS